MIKCDAVKIFLCHNSQDKPAVRRLKDRLDAIGVQTWMDECELVGGIRWQTELGKALTNAPAVAICFGPNDVGPWQGDEIEIIVQERKKSGAVVIPLILPTCANVEPEIPLFLQPLQQIDLRQNGVAIDPFGKLLSAIDRQFRVDGHYRPTVVVLSDLNEATSKDARIKIANYCRNAIFHVQNVDVSNETLLQCLHTAFKRCDVLVTLLTRDSFDPHPTEEFKNGIASGAREIAESFGIDVVQWRSDQMPLPDEEQIAERFRTTRTETNLSTSLCQHVTQTALAHFEDKQHVESIQFDRRRQAETGDGDRRRLRTVIGYPSGSGSGDSRMIREYLNENGIRCDPRDSWDHILARLRRTKYPYDALIVILNGGTEWRHECSVALDELEFDQSEFLPLIGAYYHKVEKKEDAEEIPLDLDTFREYFGQSDLERLRNNIVSLTGSQD